HRMVVREHPLQEAGRDASHDTDAIKERAPTVAVVPLLLCGDGTAEALVDDVRYAVERTGDDVHSPAQRVVDLLGLAACCRLPTKRRQGLRAGGCSTKRSPALAELLLVVVHERGHEP